MATRTLTVKIVGDVKPGEDSLIRFANSIQKAQGTVSISARKIRDDLASMEAQAVKAAAANERLGAAGTKVSPFAGLGRDAAQFSLQSGALGQFGAVQGLMDRFSTSALVAGASVAVAGAAAVKFGIDSVQAFTSGAEAVDKFQDVAGGTAEQASVFVGAAQQLGVSTDALGVSMGRLLKGANANEAAFQSYGATVVRTKNGSVDAIGTFESVAEAFAKTEDPAKRAELASLAFGRGWQGIVDVLERGGPVLDSFFQSASEHAPIFSQEDLANAVAYKQSITELHQSFTKLEVVVGGPLIQDLTSVSDALGSIANSSSGAKDFMSGLTSFLTFGAGGQLVKLEGALLGIGQGSDDAGDAVHGMGEAARNSAAGLDEWGNAIGSSGDAALGATYKFIGAGDALYQSAAAASAAAAAWQAATADMRSIHDVTENYNLSLSNLDDLNAKVTGSTGSASKAVDHSAEQIADAEKTVQDAIDGVAQAEADYARTSADVQQGLVDAEESAAKSIVDAQDRVTAARKRAADQALSSSRSIADAQQALLDAETNALKESDPFKAQRVREDAVLHLQRAQEDAASSATDSAKDVSDAQSDLADTEVQAGKDRQKAQQDAADKMTAAQKQVQDAVDQVTTANERLSRTTRDVAERQDAAAASASSAVPSHHELGKALQGVADNAAAQAYQMKLAGASDADIAAFLASTTSTINNYGSAWGFTASELDYYNRQVGLIARQVNIQYNLSLNLDQFNAKINEAAKSVGTTGAQLLADAGALGIEPILRDAGGVLPAGLSLVMNRTGRDEWVSTPDQLAAMGGGGPTIIVQGSLITERELANVIRNMNRNGY